jgi:hypothetical protein
MLNKEVHVNFVIIVMKIRHAMTSQGSGWEEMKGFGVSTCEGNRESIRCGHPLQNFT